MQGNRTACAMGAMLKQIDPLPRSKRHTAVHDRNAELGLSKRRAYVGGHVVGPFRSVAIMRVMFRREAFKEVVQIRDDVGVGVLLYGQRRRCVLAKQGEKTGVDSALSNPIRDCRREIIEALASRGDLKPGGELFHVYP